MLDLESALLAITALINVGLVAFIYSRNRQSPVNSSFALFVLFLAFWALMILEFRTTPSDEAAIYYLKLSYIAALLLAASFYYFSLVFPDGPRPNAVHTGVIAFAASSLCTALLIPSFLTKEVVPHAWGREVILGLPEYLIFAPVFLSLFVGGQARVWWKYFTAAGILKTQLLSIGLSVTVIGAIGMYFNLLLPSPFYHDFRYVWTGPIFTAVFALVTTYSIFRYKLFNAKAMVAELLVFALWLAIFVRTLLAGSQAEQISNALLLAVSVIIGVLLIRSVALEIRAQENLATANAELADLNQMKSELLSIVSHQLRGPVTAIRGYVSMIQEGTFGRIPQTVEEPIQRIADSSRALATGINDYLNVARIEQGRMTYDFKVVDLKGVVESAIAQVRPSAEKAGLLLAFETDGAASYEARLDAGKIGEAVSNLLDNAIKYTPKGSITVRLTKDATKGSLLLSIRDTGVGIEPETLPKLFQKFTRAKDANQINASGTGLGLYVARELIEAHGGRIWVESKGKGQGATFFVELPVSPSNDG